MKLFGCFLLLTTALLGVTPSHAREAANPLNADQWQTRPLILITPSAGNSQYLRMRRELKNQQEDFDRRDMALYTIESGIGYHDGAPMTDAETSALLSDLNITPDSRVIVILIGKDGGKKVEQRGYVNPEQLFSTIDNMPMRQRESSR